MKNIPEGIKRDLINQMNSASGAEKSKIVDKANALNNMVGRDLVGVEPAIMGLQTLDGVRANCLPADKL